MVGRIAATALIGPFVVLAGLTAVVLLARSNSGAGARTNCSIIVRSDGGARRRPASARYLIEARGAASRHARRAAPATRMQPVVPVGSREPSGRPLNYSDCAANRFESSSTTPASAA